jgi:putative nucleotidyltransferase with HDIG domain
MSHPVTGIISNIMTAASNCSLYSKEHPAVPAFLGRALADLEPHFVDDAASFTILGDTLLFNDDKISERSLHIGSFIKKLRRKGIEKTIIKKGLAPEEFAVFVSDLLHPAKTPGSTPHLAVGIVEVNLSASGADVSSVIREDMEKLEEIHGRFSRFENLDMVGLEEVVGSFISTLNEEANVLRVVCPVKAHNEYTFAHTTNVTILSIFQAESLGLRGEILHEIGLAGLLHDIGKTFVPNEILDKPGKLDDREWDIMRNHTVYGATYLSAMQDVPKLAVMAAYEHHMKFDGTGYPEPLRRGRQQHIISQIVAVSDFFDALRTERPYRKALEPQVVIGIMEESKGKDFNPPLVDNFVRALEEVGGLPAPASQQPAA